MRIHYVTPHFPPDRGSVETHVLRLSEFLRSRGYDVVVHTPRQPYMGENLPDRDTIDGISSVLSGHTATHSELQDLSDQISAAHSISEARR